MLLLFFWQSLSWTPEWCFSRRRNRRGIQVSISLRQSVESTINDAEKLTMELAIASRGYLDDKDSLEAFICGKKAELLNGENGAFNVFIANTDLAIIPDFDIPEDFVTTERVWYT